MKENKEMTYSSGVNQLERERTNYLSYADELEMVAS